MKRWLQGVLGYGIGSILILMILFSTVLSGLLRFTTMDTDTLNQLALLAGLSTLLFGGLMAAYKGEKKGWLTGLTTGLTFVVLIMLFQVIFENRWVSVPQLSYFGGLLLAASLGGMIGINLPRRSVKH
ncbi:TIGR04086 family membrane protein [Halobacillus sp. Marseille-Q1614]|uniref:TIGR04086 family membrane protein n=1 Tax=Halobacillus sp. Marseille-Q1614 TaxID=2709134 RepID=UPI00156E5638|nr:TIGR04086 family membrane protein [Halobacillus sp. Marseille-Q1614]